MRGGWWSNCRHLSVLILLAMLTACSSSSTKDTAKPSTSVGLYKLGNPYQVNGVWYYPQIDWEYRETGIASWYGPGFHGKSTANGEIFNENDITAAHRTLPMPAMVQVTNLENGRSIKVRINDRGPFANNRIIDLSRRSAQLLGMEKQGTAKVLVEILPDESRQLIAAAQGRSVDDLDIPQAAPVGVVESKPLDGGGATPVRTAAAAPRTAAQEPVPWPTGEVQHKKVTPTQIYIQAGSFANPGNAEMLKRQLASYGPTSITAVQIGTQNFYRVRIGPLASVGEADRVLNSVIAGGHHEAQVVVDR